MKKYSLLLTGCLIAAALSAQTRKTLEAAYRRDIPEIDGVPSESCWQALPAIGDFVTSTPVFGETPHCRTEVRLFYTETALYLAARCFDPDAGGIRRDGGIRDGELTGDWFQLSIDTWNDDRLSFDFIVSAAGIQQDVREGSGWDANWQSAVAYQSDGWTLEMRIPYTALRYTQRPEQTWGVQFTRFDRSRGETSTWNPQDPLVQDRVWQFGTLTGLKDIRQEKRHALAIHSSTALRTPSGSFGIDNVGTLVQSAGIDARLGLSESATLDVTILPPLSISKYLGDAPFSLGRNFAGNAVLPAPRQLLAEESGLFERVNGSLEPNPVISPFQLTWRKPLAPGYAYTNFFNSKLLNAVKFTGRTKGNWRFGAYHATLGPVRSEVINFLSSNSNNREKITYQKLSSYSYLTAEYILPNNGYARVSNAAILAGQDMYTFLPGVDFRVRNRANNLEIKGNTLLNFLKTDTIQNEGYRFNLALSRINRRWGWSLQHWSNHPESNPFLLSPFFVPSTWYSFSSGSVSFQDFQPRGPWLNRKGYLALSTIWGHGAGVANVWTLDIAVQALDKRFRRFALGASLVPHNQIFRYGDTGGAYISQQVAPRVGILAGFATDARRRFSMSNTARGWIHTEGKFPALQDSFGISWVINRHFTLGSRVFFGAAFQQLILLNTPGKWIFEQRDSWGGSGLLELNWYAHPRLRIFGAAGLNQHNYTNREALELQDNGDLTPVVHPSGNQSEVYTDWEGEIGLQYVISPLKQIRVRHRISPNQFSVITSPGVFPGVQGASSLTQLEVIYTLGGGGKAPKGR